MTTLVLLPGMDGSGDLFADFAAALARRSPALKVVIVRYPPEEPWGYERIAEYVQTCLPADEPYMLLGESFSGPAAIRLAAQAPAGLAGLVLCCTFARNPAPLMRLLQPWLTRIDHPPMALLRFYLVGGNNAALEARLQAALAKLAPGVLGARAAAVLGVDVSDALARIRVPLLYLRASRDRLVPRHVAESMQRILPAMRIADFDSPHLLLQTRPDEAAARLLDFTASAQVRR